MPKACLYVFPQYVAHALYNPLSYKGLSCGVGGESLVLGLQVQGGELFLEELSTLSLPIFFQSGEVFLQRVKFTLPILDFS